MATVKRFSVAITDGDAVSNANSSTVYSVTGCENANAANNTLPDGSWCTPAYQYADGECMPVGRTPDTFVARVGASNPTVSATGLIDEFDAITQVDGVPGTPRNTTVMCTTTTVTTATEGSVAAGLIVEFDTTDEANPENPAANADYTIVCFGEGYADNDVVEIDGFPGSRLTVNGLVA